MIIIYLIISKDTFQNDVYIKPKQYKQVQRDLKVLMNHLKKKKRISSQFCCCKNKLCKLMKKKKKMF